MPFRICKHFPTMSSNSFLNTLQNLIPAGTELEQVFIPACRGCTCLHFAKKRKHYFKNSLTKTEKKHPPNKLKPGHKHLQQSLLWPQREAKLPKPCSSHYWAGNGPCSSTGLEYVTLSTELGLCIVPRLCVPVQRHFLFWDASLGLVSPRRS